MPDYCSLSDIQGEIQNTAFSTTTRPSTTQVAAWCTDISQEIQTILTAHAVNFPITDAGALLLFRRMATYGVVERVYNTMGQGLAQGAAFGKKYQAELARISENPWIANPAGTRQDAIQSSFPAEKVFQKGVQQW